MLCVCDGVVGRISEGAAGTGEGEIAGLGGENIMLR